MIAVQKYHNTTVSLFLLFSLDSLVCRNHLTHTQSPSFTSQDLVHLTKPIKQLKYYLCLFECYVMLKQSFTWCCKCLVK